MFRIIRQQIFKEIHHQSSPIRTIDHEADEVEFETQDGKDAIKYKKPGRSRYSWEVIPNEAEMEEWFDSYSLKIIDLDTDETVYEIYLDGSSEDAEAESLLASVELSVDISERPLELDEIIKIVEDEYPDFRFDRTESRYRSCLMAIFTHI